MDRTTAYAISLTSGAIEKPVGKTEISAGQRHLNDLERQGTEDFPYIWDIKKSLSMINFAENLVLAEGTHPAPMHCVGYQEFVFGSWQGWVHKDTGFRRFKTSYVQIARQNGKSVGNAVPSLYYGNFSGYQYPQIYATATKELQARIVLNECQKFIKSDVELSGTKTKAGLFTIQDYRSAILCNLSNGLIRALGRDTDSIDGFRPYFGSVDEYHKHKTNQMYKLLVDGGRNMVEFLISVITTAGFDINCPCKELYDYCKTILAGLVVDDTQFVYIAEPDLEDVEGDRIYNEEIWPKSNPLWTPQMLTNMRAEAIKARVMGGAELRNFMTKSLNIWVQAKDHQYLNIENWKKCESNTTLEDMRGRECFLGLDLSSGGDLTSGVLEFPLDIEGSRKYFLSSHSFMPSKRLAEHIKTDRAPYDMWVREGLLDLTETLGGVKTDYKYIIAYYKRIIAEYDLKLKVIAYDPHNADAFLGDLDEFGVDCIMIVQSAKSLNDATVDFNLEVDAGNVLYDKKDKILAWSFGWAVTTSNSFGEIKIDKENRVERIDPCDATIDAHKVTILNRPEYTPDVYTTDEFLNKLWG